MTDQGQTSGTTRSSKDRWIKAAFLLVTIGAVAAVLFIQRSRPRLPGWGDDLDAALAQAGGEGRRVLVLFLSDPPSETARWLAKNTLKLNRRQIEAGGFIAVTATLDTALTCELAERYRVRELPTLMILSPAGEELNRRTGRVGQVPFEKGFLDCTQIEGPAPKSARGSPVSS